MKWNFSLTEAIIKLFRNKLFIFLVFLLLPYLFFAYRVNIFQVAIAPGDGTIQGIPTKIFSSWVQLWNPYVQTGSFPVKDIGWQALYLPGILVMRLFPNAFGYNLLLLAHYSFAGYFTYLFLEKLNLRRTAAFISAFTFMFSGFLIAHKGHHTMLMAASYIPSIFYYFQCYASTKKSRFLLIAGILFGMSILADYTAVPMYIGMVLFPYMICTFLFDRTFASTTVHGAKNFYQAFLDKLLLIVRSSLLVFGTGLFIAAAQLLPIVESLQYVTRQSVSYDVFASYSFRISLLPMLIFPFYFGNDSAQWIGDISYFGPRNLTELTGYMGIMPLFFAGTGIILFWKKSWQVIFWGAAALVAFVLVLGDSTPFYRIMYHIPIYNMFRVPARNWLEVHFAVAVLSGYFISYIIDSPQAVIKRYLKIIVPALAVFLLGVFFLLTSYHQWWDEERMSSLIYENTRLSSPAVYIPLAVIAVSAILLLAIYLFKQKRQLWLFVGLFIILDLFSLGNFHNTGYPDLKFFQNKTAAVAAFLNHEDPHKDLYRILPLKPSFWKLNESQMYPSINVLYKFNAINGYSAIWLKDYSHLTKFGAEGVSSSQDTLLQNFKILSLLSTKYILISNPAEKDYIEALMVANNSSQITERVNNHLGADKSEISSSLSPLYPLRYESPEGVAVYENMNFLPRARFVQNVHKVENTAAAIETLWSDPEFNPEKTALIEGYTGEDHFESGEVLATDYSKSEVVSLQVKTGGRSFLVLSDAYYVGWKAYVDGKETPIYKTNATLRGIIIDGAGEHAVKFLFVPMSFYIGLAISTLALLMVTFSITRPRM